VVGCAGSQGSASDGGGGGDGCGGCDGGDGGGSDGGITAPDGGAQPEDLFPLGVSSDGSFLVGRDGTPFLLHGEAAWSLIVQLSTADATRYLADRRTRGVNAVIVNLIEHHFAARPPRNASGDAPFTTAGDFSTPNEKYFAHADQVIDIAADQGIAVLLFPAYLGFGGGEQGWYQEMTKLTEATCQAYGDFVGRRYANKTNIVWMWGGDYTPPSGDPGESCMKVIRDRIVAAAPNALTSAHWAPESTSRSEAAFADAIDLVGVYTYQDVLPACQTARAVTPRKPTFLIETCYENEGIQSCMKLPMEARRRQWWGLLSCGAGEISGNDPIWSFDTGWPQALTSPVSISQVRLVTIARSLLWQSLVPDNTLITAGLGSGYTQVAAARTADRKQALIYLPPGAASSITVDLSRMIEPVTATWQDPTAVGSMSAGGGLTGSLKFTAPGRNASGDSDWVLVLSTP
jgi:hypothetical protein